MYGGSNPGGTFGKPVNYNHLPECECYVCEPSSPHDYAYRPENQVTTDVLFDQVKAKKERRIMSAALWCDKGNHAFSANDKNRQHFSQTRNEEKVNTRGYVDSEVVTTEIDMCGPCWKNTNPFQADEKPAIQGPTMEDVEADAEKAEAEMWKAKYEAERVRNNTTRAYLDN